MRKIALWLLLLTAAALAATPTGLSQAVTAAYTVPDLIKAHTEKTVHFLIGDAIALSDLAMKAGVNLNIELRGGEWMAPVTALDP